MPKAVIIGFLVFITLVGLGFHLGQYSANPVLSWAGCGMITAGIFVGIYTKLAHD